MTPAPHLELPHAPGYPPAAHRIGARTRRRGALAVVAALACAALVTGCGLRIETPAQPAPTPGVDEAARQRGNADAAALEILAAAPGADPADAVVALRATVAAHAGAHLDQLGPMPGTASTATSAASPAVTTGSTPATAAPDAFLAQLVQAATNAHRDAVTVPDGGLARLLASVSVERLLLARQLAAAAGLPGPELPAVSIPETAPAGVSASALSELVADEDEAGYGFEVIAAKLGGDARVHALDRAAVHRARAEGWAGLATIARTDLDPRRTVYAVPAGLDDPATATALAQTLERSLAASYAALVSGAEPASRSGLVDAVAEATDAATSWGAAVPAFPGMPELAPVA